MFAFFRLRRSVFFRLFVELFVLEWSVQTARRDCETRRNTVSRARDSFFSADLVDITAPPTSEVTSVVDRSDDRLCKYT